MEEGTGMTTAQVGYAHVHRWVKEVLGSTHTTVVMTITWAVLCLLVAQRVTAATLARALPAEQAGSGRSCLRRVRRWWQGPALDQATISPALIRLALTLLAGTQPVVAMDTTRLGAWEVWLAGIVVAGRTLPIGWAVIPYPWPKGRFRVTTLALIQQLQQAFPAAVRWTLVADRGFPSAMLFAQLRQGGTDFSVRLRLSDWVTVAGVYAMVAAHLAAGRLMDGQRTAAAMGRGRSAQPLVPGWVVVSTAVAPGPQDAPAECDGAALCPNLGAVHHGADGHAGGGGVCQTDVDRRDLSRLASSLGCPSGCRWPADRGDGRTPDRRGLLGLYGADAPRPARVRGSHEPAKTSTMDRDRPDQLVLARSTTVHRSWLRLEQLAGSAMGKSAAAGDHYSSPAYVRDCLAISPSGGSLTQRWPLPRAYPPSCST